MKIFRLDSGTFYPDTSPTAMLKFDPSKDTIVWTERYQTNGDFKIVIKDDISVLTTFPTGSLISHTDTKEVMIVEDHLIKRAEDKSLEVTVTGRSFETFSEHRVTDGTRSALYTTPGNAAINQIITDEAEDAAVTLLTLALVAPTTVANDAIPNVTVNKAIRVMDSVLSHTIKRGSVYSAVLELLKLSKSGLKTTRPNPLHALTTLDLTVHDGVDRTATVVFRASNDDLEDAAYLWSIRDYKNYAQIATHITSRQYRHRDIPSALTGLDRRYMYVEANELEGAYTVPTNSDEVATLGQNELDNHKKITLIGAKIATTAKPKFKLHYDIGDLVTVNGEFSTSSTFQVTEHILTIDKDGIRGFPSLSIL